MIFIRRESFKQYIRLYPITSMILLLNIIMFLLMSIHGSSKSSLTLVTFGAIFNHPEYTSAIWRYFASTFLHVGFDHLLFNSISLFIFAPPLERLLGKLQYVLLYLGSGAVGSFASVILLPALTISAGASGAIYGVFGAFVAMGRFRRDLIDQQSLKTIYIILVIGIIYSFMNPVVNLYAHLGGFIGGFAWFYLMLRKA